jgi:hypothetical protein
MKSSMKPFRASNRPISFPSLRLYYYIVIIVHPSSFDLPTVPLYIYTLIAFLKDVRSHTNIYNITLQKSTLLSHHMLKLILEPECLSVTTASYRTAELSRILIIYWMVAVKREKNQSVPVTTSGNRSTLSLTKPRRQIRSSSTSLVPPLQSHSSES